MMIYLNILILTVSIVNSLAVLIFNGYMRKNKRNNIIIISDYILNS